MPALFLFIFRFFRLLMSGHPAVALENAALRLPLAACQRKRKRPVLTTLDRVFWVTLRRWWFGWRGPLFSVQAGTVTHWQRERFAGFGPDGATRIADDEADQLRLAGFAH